MRRLKKKFKKPKVSWNTELIEENKKLLKEYGLRRKREIWRAQNELRLIRREARKMISIKDESKEKILLDKLSRMGLLTSNASIDDVLSLKLEDLLNRRLQTVVFNKGIADTIKQARQMITHGHITVNGRIIKFPSYMVNKNEESSIELNISSKNKFKSKQKHLEKVQSDDKGQQKASLSKEKETVGEQTPVETIPEKPTENTEPVPENGAENPEEISL